MGGAFANNSIAAHKVIIEYFSSGHYYYNKRQGIRKFNIHFINNLIYEYIPMCKIWKESFKLILECSKVFNPLLTPSGSLNAHDIYIFTIVDIAKPLPESHICYILVCIIQWAWRQMLNVTALLIQNVTAIIIIQHKRQHTHSRRYRQ